MIQLIFTVLLFVVLYHCIKWLLSHKKLHDTKKDLLKARIEESVLRVEAKVEKQKQQNNTYKNNE